DAGRELRLRLARRESERHAGRKLLALVNLLDSLQVLQQLAAPITQVLPPRPLHSCISALPAFVQVPGGPLKTGIRIEYDDFLLCHAVTFPECMNQRNLSDWSGIVVDRAQFGCRCGKV